MEDLTQESLVSNSDQLPLSFGSHTLIERVESDPVLEGFIAISTGAAEDEPLSILRAVRPRLAVEQPFARLFVSESRRVAEISSANVARLDEVDQVSGVPFTVRQRAWGPSLGQLMRLSADRRTPWPWELAAHVAAELLRGLDHVHNLADAHGEPARLRHGDIRPANLLISFNGEVTLTNFATSLYFIVDQDALEMWRQARGSYALPEPGAGEEASLAGDLWGAAVILWVLLANKPPSVETLRGNRSWTPPPMAQMVESMPPALDSFLVGALNPDPEYRYQSAESMREALLGIMEDHVTGHPPDDLAAWARHLAHQQWRWQERRVRMMVSAQPSRAGDAASQAGDLAPGAVVDQRYRLIRRLGEGGMGVVFAAEHLGLGRQVALKVIHDEAMDDLAALERFRREARITGALGHPNIVEVSDFGITEDGRHFLAMELLEGESLGQRISRGPVPARELAEIMARVCDGLEAAHQAGVIHRDLKPDNVILAAQGPKILDFGIARKTGLDSEETALTRTGHICGTAEYIAPEQVRGLPPDPRSDVFSAGVILYEALTRRTPFRGRTVGETLNKLMNEKPIPPRKLTGDRTIPVELEKICLKALSRSIERRYRTAGEMAAALDRILPLSDRQTSEVSSPRIGPRRTSFWVGLAAGGAAVLTVVALLVLFGPGSTEPPSGSTADSSALDPALSDQSAGQRADSPVVQLPAEPAEDAQEPTDALKYKRSSDLREQATPQPPANDQAHRDKRVLELLAAADKSLAAMDLPQAAELYGQAKKLAPGQARARYGLGKVAFQQGRFTPAVQQIEQALSLRPNNHRWRLFLGQVYMTQGQRKKAIAEWRKVLHTDPHNPEAQRLLNKAGAL